jgi:hypothetical protein
VEDDIIAVQAATIERYRRVMSIIAGLFVRAEAQ